MLAAGPPPPLLRLLGLFLFLLEELVAPPAMGPLRVQDGAARVQGGLPISVIPWLGSTCECVMTVDSLSAMSSCPSQTRCQQRRGIMVAGTLLRGCRIPKIVETGSLLARSQNMPGKKASTCSTVF